MMFACKPPAALASANANWATGVEAGLPANASSSPGVDLTSVSCSSAGNCAAVGRYLDGSAHSQGLLQSQSSGAWATGVQASLPADAAVVQPSVSLSSVSCASAGDCSAVGGYVDSSGRFEGLLLTETAGTWATGVEAQLPADAGKFPNVTPTSVSCVSPGNCTAVGFYIDSSDTTQGVRWTETAGTWSTGARVSLPADAGMFPNVALDSVSCPAPGNCVAVGQYTDDSGHLQGLLLSETGGAWATGVKAALPANAAASPIVDIKSVSCVSPGNCAAVGQYEDGSDNNQGLLLTETTGVWATGVEARLAANVGTFPNVALDSVSCPSPGDCAASGQYIDDSNQIQGLLLTEGSGTWATGAKASLPANANANPIGSVNSVSCASVGSCAAVGAYNAGSNAQGLLLSAAPVSPKLSASAPASATAGSPVPAASVAATLAGGAAPIGTVAFKVFGPQPAPPGLCTSGGTMVGSASVSGNATYHPSAGFTPATPGDYWWYASYGGDPSDSPAASACGAAKTIVAPPGQPPGPPSIKPHRPSLSAVNLGSKRFAARKGTKLKLTVSQAAAIRVLITRAVKGRRVRGVCKRGAKAGKRCTTTITKRTLRFSAKAGANTFKLRLRGLAKGKYAVAVTAQNANGRSGTVKRKFTIARR